METIGMIEPNISLYVSDSASWMLNIVDKSNIKYYVDINQALATDAKKVAVGLLQSNSSCELADIKFYQKNFDKVVLLNCETPINLVDIVKQIDFDNVILLTIGCLNYQPQNMKVVNIETFFGLVHHAYKQFNFESLSQLDPYKTKSYYFDALLGTPKNHRTFIYNKIQEYCPDKFYFRYMNQGNVTLEQALEKKLFEWPTDTAKIIAESNTSNWYSGNLVEYGNMQLSLSALLPIDIYNCSAYSIVAETHSNTEHVMLTEKTAKVLLGRRLGIWFSSMGSLKHLRSLGFQTFEGIIDESYDLDPCHETRWNHAFDQVKYLCEQDQEKILDQIKPIVEHNYKLFVSRDWNNEYHTCLVDYLTT